MIFNDRIDTPVEENPAHPEKRPLVKPFDKKMVMRGALWFALLTVSSIAAVFFYTHTGDTIIALTRIRLRYILTCCLMVMIDLQLGSWRNHIFIKVLKPGIPQSVSFRANVANMFMGAVTPFHSGAGPAQLYVYNRHGLPVQDGFVVSLINMGATLLFMPVAGLFAIWMMKDHLSSGLIPLLLRYGFAVFSIFLFGFLMVFWKPVWIGKLLTQLARAIGVCFPARRKKMYVWASTAQAVVLKHQELSKSLLLDHPFLFPRAMLITTLLYLNKYCMQYVILLGLGISARLTDVISIQVLIQFMIYFAPSPGGSGFAEASIAALFGRLVPAGLLPVFTLLQRSFLLFFPAIAGAFVMIRLLRTQASGKTAPD